MKRFEEKQKNVFRKKMDTSSESRKNGKSIEF